MARNAKYQAKHEHEHWHLTHAGGDQPPSFVVHTHEHRIDNTHPEGDPPKVQREE